MKKTFDFEEIVKYYHIIEVEVENEEEFDDFVDDLGNSINSSVFDNRGEVLHMFIGEFGEANVTFIEGHPNVEIE